HPKRVRYIVRLEVQDSNPGRSDPATQPGEYLHPGSAVLKVGTELHLVRGGMRERRLDNSVQEPAELRPRRQTTQALRHQRRVRIEPDADERVPRGQDTVHSLGEFLRHGPRVMSLGGKGL